MKYSTTFTILTLGLVLICACNTERYDAEDDFRTSDRSAKSRYAVSIDEAISNLDSFISGLQEGDTKSGISARTVASVDLISLSKLRTKADIGVDDTSDIDNLVYLVNFTDSSGYAMLAADSRLREDVIFYVEDGSLSEEALVAAFIGDQTRPIYPAYPTTGPGIIVDEEGNEYINPNTFQLYDEEADDSYVGTLTIQKDTVAGQLTTLRLAMATRSLDYSINQLIQMRPEDRYQDGEEVTIMTSRRDSTNTLVVSPLLSSFSFWYQGDPFNQFSPMVRKSLFSSEWVLADAGCVPLAIAKIIAHFRYPSTMVINGIQIDWDSMSNAGNCISAAALIRWIGMSSGTIYTSGFSGTFPSSAARCLGSEFLYRNVDYVDYDTDTVTAMLDNGCPLFVCSVPKLGFLSYDIASAHGWNIDGYKLLEYNLVTNYYKNATVFKTTTERISTVYVHCDFGWNRAGNGYFVSGVFDLSAEQDWDGKLTSIKSNYNWYQKLIIYDSPVQQ